MKEITVKKTYDLPAIEVRGRIYESRGYGHDNYHNGQIEFLKRAAGWIAELRLPGGRNNPQTSHCETPEAALDALAVLITERLTELRNAWEAVTGSEGGASTDERRYWK